MKLSDYMLENGISDEALSKLVNRNRSNVTRWRLGSSRPDWNALAALEKVTDGAVTARDFVREPAQ